MSLAPTPSPLLGIASQLSVLAVFVCLCFVLIFEAGSGLQEKDKIDKSKREQPCPLWSRGASISLAISQPHLMSSLMMGKGCSSKPADKGPQEAGPTKGDSRGCTKGAPRGSTPGGPQPQGQICHHTALPHLQQAAATRCQCLGLQRQLQ